MDKRSLDIYNLLEQTILDPKCELNFNNNYELLVAVMLSAQCTDKRVNVVTKKLFEIYPDIKSLSVAPMEDIEEIIKPCGFFHNKAKNIKSACSDIVERFDGVVPDNLDDLISLRGVGRKTANVVLAEGFSVPSIAVDTHVGRVSARLNLTRSSNPSAIEKDLMKKFDKVYWIKLHHLLIHFGRYRCKSRNPKCLDCVLKKYCRWEGK